MKASRIGRGFNLIALNSETYELKLTETFDTYIDGRNAEGRPDGIVQGTRCRLTFLSDTFLIRALRMTLGNGDIVILTSFDEMSHG